MSYECSFFIFPGVGLVVSKLGTRPSHIDMLKGMGFSDEQIDTIIRHVPRGYYKDGFVAVYQEYDIHNIGYVLEVKPENEAAVKEGLADLKTLLNLTNDVDVYYGVKVGEIGTVWELQRKNKLGDILK